MVRVLFVCTGNTCRSPMAEELMDDAVGRSTSLAGKVKSRSAGTFACEGAEATDEAKQVMEEYGLNIEKHRARQFSAELAEKYDLLLAMGPIVFEQMEAIAPDQVHKMHTVIGYAEGMDGERVEERFAIFDPFDKDIDAYRVCARQLSDAVEKMLKRLEINTK